MQGLRLFPSRFQGVLLLIRKGNEIVSVARREINLSMQRRPSMYQPHTISDSEFTLQNKNLASVYAVERDIVRLDERIRHSPCASAVRKTLVRGDALSTLGIQGIWIDIYTLLRVEIAATLIKDDAASDKAIKEILAHERHPDLEKALSAYRYEQTIEWLTDPQSPISITSPQDMLEVYRRCKWGAGKKKRAVDFRKTTLNQKNTDASFTSYEPPDPQDLSAFLTDFCSFINSDTLTPITQASIAQFQFEALRPFDDNLDSMERLIMHYILSQRKLVQNVTMPLNLFAGHFKKQFAAILRPYLNPENKEERSTVDYIEAYTLHMVDVAYEVLRTTVSMNKITSAFIDAWKTRLGRTERGSAAELLLYQFAGIPILTISHASKLIGKSFSTTSEAFARLEKAHIIRAGKSINRNKTFEAPDAIVLHEGMYQKRAITFEEWTS